MYRLNDDSKIGGFLACSGKMVRPHQMAVEDFWLAAGRWSGPIRQLWRISGMLWEDGQAPSDSCGEFLACSGRWSGPNGGFLACSGKMVMSRTEDFWSALGRWSGPIRRLWRIAGLLQEDGHAQYSVVSGVLWEDGQAPSDGYGGLLACSRKMVMPSTLWFLECSGKMVRPHQTAMEDCWSALGMSQGLNAYNGSDGNPGVLGVPGGLGSIGLVGTKRIALSYAPLTMVTSLTSPYPLRFLRLKYSSVRQNITYDCGSGVDGFTKMRHQAADSTTFQFGVDRALNHSLS
ncbi:hypothetical protein EMCRGX_G002006 [Ephydatia muelleri]